SQTADDPSAHYRRDYARETLYRRGHAENSSATICRRVLSDEARKRRARDSRSEREEEGRYKELPPYVYKEEPEKPYHARHQPHPQSVPFAELLHERSYDAALPDDSEYTDRCKEIARLLCSKLELAIGVKSEHRDVERKRKREEEKDEEKIPQIIQFDVVEHPHVGVESEFTLFSGVPRGFGQKKGCSRYTR